MIYRMPESNPNSLKQIVDNILASIVEEKRKIQLCYRLLRRLYIPTRNVNMLEKQRICKQFAEELKLLKQVELKLQADYNSLLNNYPQYVLPHLEKIMTYRNYYGSKLISKWIGGPEGLSSSFMLRMYSKNALDDTEIKTMNDSIKHTVSTVLEPLISILSFLESDFKAISENPSIL